MANCNLSVSLQVEDIANRTVKRIEAVSQYAKGTVLRKMLDDTNPLVPYKTGKLANNISILPGNTGVEYSQPYASFAFMPYTSDGSLKNYTTYNHPQACGFPFDVNMKMNKSKYEEFYAQQLLKLALKGR